MAAHLVTVAQLFNPKLQSEKFKMNEGEDSFLSEKVSNLPLT